MSTKLAPAASPGVVGSRRRRFPSHQQIGEGAGAYPCGLSKRKEKAGKDRQRAEHGGSVDRHNLVATRCFGLKCRLRLPHIAPVSKQNVYAGFCDLPVLVWWHIACPLPRLASSELRADSRASHLLPSWSGWGSINRTGCKPCAASVDCSSRRLGDRARSSTPQRAARGAGSRARRRLEPPLYRPPTRHRAVKRHLDQAFARGE